MAGEPHAAPAADARTPAEPKPHRRRNLTVGAAVAVVALYLGVTLDALELWDRIFGDDPPKPAPTLTVARELRTDVPWSEYLRAHPEASAQDAYTQAQLDWFGEEFGVTASVEGSSGKRAVLTWEVFQPPGVPLQLPAWAPRQLEQDVGGDGRVQFRAWVAVPEGAGELYPKFELTVEGTNPAPAVTGPTLTIARG